MVLLVCLFLFTDNDACEQTVSTHGCPGYNDFDYQNIIGLLAQIWSAIYTASANLPPLTPDDVPNGYSMNDMTEDYEKGLETLQQSLEGLIKYLQEKITPLEQKSPWDDALPTRRAT